MGGRCRYSVGVGGNLGADLTLGYWRVTYGVDVVTLRSG